MESNKGVYPFKIRKMRKHVSILLLLFSLALTAQEQPTDMDMVVETIENYFYGYVERDGTKLYSAFDTENGVMKIPIESGGAVTGYENGLFKEIIPKWAGRDKLSAEELKNCHLTILSSDIEPDGIASAKMKMEVGDKTYIDILSLQKIAGRWKVTNKIYIELE